MFGFMGTAYSQDKLQLADTLLINGDTIIMLGDSIIIKEKKFSKPNSSAK